MKLFEPSQHFDKDIDLRSIVVYAWSDILLKFFFVYTNILQWEFQTQKTFTYEVANFLFVKSFAGQRQKERHHLLSSSLINSFYRGKSVFILKFTNKMHAY